jgi:hypothetical protein
MPILTLSLQVTIPQRLPLSKRMIDILCGPQLWASLESMKVTASDLKKEIMS